MRASYILKQLFHGLLIVLSLGQYGTGFTVLSDFNKRYESFLTKLGSNPILPSGALVDDFAVLSQDVFAGTILSLVGAKSQAKQKEDNEQT